MRQLPAILLSLCLLTGCTPLLEREYCTVETHSSKFWESEAADTLRAENYQDIVNDLLILVAQHSESATLRFYGVEDEMVLADMMDRAAAEVQLETPLGSYAVEYITAAREEQRGHYEVSVRIGYRRSAEQLQAVVSATSPEALQSLLETALADGRRELSVRISYWDSEGPAAVEHAVSQVREAHGLTETPPWIINCYPEEGTVGLIEFLLAPPPEPESPPEEAPADPLSPASEPAAEPVQ